MQTRQVPPQNLLRVNWTGVNTRWSPADFSNVLSVPFQSMLASRQLTNQIDYVVLSMDIPYGISINPTTSVIDDSTTSKLFYGYYPDTTPRTNCSVAVGSANAYAGSEGIFRQTPPVNAASNSYLVTMITASNLTQAKTIVDQGVQGDSTFPSQTVALGKSTDTIRNIRFAEYDNTVFDTRLRGD